MIGIDAKAKGPRDSARSSEGLGVCPIDGYSLYGLPAAHRCPECGFRFDSHTHVWLAPNLARYAGVGFVVFISLALGGFASLNSTQFVGLRYLIAAVLTSICGLAIVQSVFAFLNRPFVAVAPDGLILRLRSRTIRIIPWERVGEPLIRSIGKRSFVRVPLDDGRRPIDVSAFVRDSTSATKFQLAVRERLLDDPAK